ncbi:MAG: hypothetical protein QHC89_01750 [Bosea sp. (in: a-proteobacteria)]|nr:hypothetical protein [Bosea sp. (in: a-proteobacteria)]
MSVSVNDLPVSLEFGEGSAQAVARAVGLPDDHFEGWRFMSAEETADYIERRNAGEIDDLVEEV